MTTASDMRRTRMHDLRLVLRRALTELRQLEATERRVARLRQQIKPAPDSTTATTEAQRIRIWALEQGIPVSPTGRIPKRVRDAYEDRT